MHKLLYFVSKYAEEGTSYDPEAGDFVIDASLQVVENSPLVPLLRNSKVEPVLGQCFYEVSADTFTRLTGQLAGDVDGDGVVDATDQALVDGIAADNEPAPAE